MSERIFNIHDVIVIVISLECLLLALFQVVQTQSRVHTKYFLAGFLVAMSVSYTAVLSLWNDALVLPRFIDEHLLPCILIISLCARGPFLYLYARSITNPSYTFTRQRVLHFIVIPLALLYAIVFSVSGTDLRMEGPPESKAIANKLWDTIKIISLAYTAATLYQIYQYKKGLRESYSRFSTLEINWLTLLTLGFFITWSWGIIVHLVGQFTDIQAATTNRMGIAANYMAFVLINTLFIYSLLYAHKLLPEKTKKAEKKKAPTEEPLAESDIAAVKAGIDKKQIHLEQNINIEQFAAQIDLPVKTVSSVLNRHFGTNFFEFINSNRVDAAKQMLADPACDKMTILEILLAAGFNSTSSFHRQFKRFAEVSPTAYRQNARAEAKAAAESEALNSELE